MTVPPIEQEPDRVPRGLVRSSAVVLFAMIAASVGATLLLGRGGLGEAEPVGGDPPAFFDTELFDHEVQGERDARIARERLRRYGWVDRANGIVHVPLEVAIEHYLAEKPR